MPKTKQKDRATDKLLHSLICIFQPESLKIKQKSVVQKRNKGLIFKEKQP
jgi:hypothetical protein